MKRVTIIALVFLIGGTIHAQNLTDALRYSEMETQGTARFNAMGGSFGALGGEVSGLSKNPAGIGIFRNSEFTISSGFNVIDSDSRYLGVDKTDGRLNFNIPNISYVGTYKGDPNGWKIYSFGLSYNRITSFSEETRINGTSRNSSIIDDYLDFLNDDRAILEDVESFQYPFGPSEAYNVFMINEDTNQQFSYTEYSQALYGILPNRISQDRVVTTRGNQSETAFTFGGNYLDRLYLGGAIGFQQVRFNRETEYNENYGYVDTINRADFYPVLYTEDYSQSVNGSGLNFKIGAIYRLTDAFRIGAAIHSPTFFSFQEEFVYSASSKAINGTAEESGESVGEYNYRLRTPARFLGSLGYVFMQKAALNVEYEYVDFSRAKLNDSRDDEFDFSGPNQTIESSLKGTHNIRVGAEIMEGPFVFRAGFRYDDSPFSSSTALNPDDSRKTYSLGGGFRSKNYTIDVAYSTFKRSTIDQLYATNPAFADVDHREHNLVFTVGWKW